jgi:hypothetical protein
MLGGAALAVAVLIFVVAPRPTSSTWATASEDLRDEVAARKKWSVTCVSELAVETAPAGRRAPRGTELKMVEPTEKDIVVIERVPVSPRPTGPSSRPRAERRRSWANSGGPAFLVGRTAVSDSPSETTAGRPL